MRAIQITEFGGPDVLTLTDLPSPTPREDRLLLDVAAAGVNFADTHQSEDSYLRPQRLPMIPGAEVVGTDPDGRRLVALTSGGGGYAEQALVHPAAAVELPDGVEDGAALALVLQGTTAWHLLRTSAHLAAGETVVVHAAAGGVGSLAVQLAKRWGAGRVVATASTADKRDLAVSLGADVAVDVSAAADADTVAEVLRDANEGRDVDVVLEMTGGHVFDGSLAALAPLGRLVTFGTASRTPASTVAPGSLVIASRAVIGFWLVHALRIAGGLTQPMEEMLSLVHAGALRTVVGGHYPLAEARRAHEDLLSRRTTGKLVLDVAG